jgi:D-aspartate ligase
VCSPCRSDGSYFAGFIVQTCSYAEATMTNLLSTPLHQLDRTRLPVFLLGGLNLVRALGLAGIQVIVATSEPGEPAVHSRYCTVAAMLPPLDQHDARVDAIASLGERLAGLYGRRVPLMYGGDDALELLYAHRERLARYFLFLICEPEVAASLIAKDRFQAFAEENGLPVPRALQWDGVGAQSLLDYGREVVVKPRAKRDWHNSPLCHRLFNGDGKAIVFASGAAARANPVVALFHDQLAFQQYIPGDDTALWSFHGFADKKGDVIAGFTGRKIRTYPAGMGESAFIELARNAELEKLGPEIARRAQLRGPFKIDLKRDPGDDRWYVLEVNARYTLWQYLGAANGMNLMRTAYDYLAEGQRTTFAAPASRLRWLDLALDFKAARELRRKGELGWLRWAGSLVASRKLHTLFSWSDPLPFAHLAWHRVHRKVGRGPAKVFHTLRQWASTAS